MKRYLILPLLLMSLPAFGVSSVRTLGNVGAAVPLGTTGGKTTPVRASSTKFTSGASSLSRIGSTRPASSASVKGAITSSVSRAPIVPVKMYSLTTGAQGGGTTTGSTSGGGENTGGSCCNVDVEAIINAVLNRVAEEYYDKTEVYDNDEFRTAVLELIPDSDEDPRIDAVRIVGTANNQTPVQVWQAKQKSLPNDYVYIWVESGN